jgi:hypothetical protein
VDGGPAVLAGVCMGGGVARGGGRGKQMAGGLTGGRTFNERRGRLAPRQLDGLVAAKPHIRKLRSATAARAAQPPK